MESINSEDKDQTKRQFIKDLNQKQLQILEEFRLIIKQKKILDNQPTYIVEKYTDDNQLIRILIARDFKIKDATQMWDKFVEWRFNNKADEIELDEIQHELQAGKAFFHGYDKQNNPILIVKTKFHFPGQIHIEETKRFFLFLMEVGIYLSEKSGTERISIIYDREGFSQSKNFDSSVLSLFKSIIGIMQDNYSERMDKCFILHPNIFFKMIFGMIKPFLTKRTKDKIVVINKLQELQQYIDSDNLLIEHSGTSEFKYNYPPIYADIYEKEIKLKNKNDKIQTQNLDQDKQDSQEQQNYDQNQEQNDQALDEKADSIQKNMNQQQNEEQKQEFDYNIQDIDNEQDIDLKNHQNDEDMNLNDNQNKL